MKKTVWIARDTSGELFAYSSEPQKLDFPEEEPVGYFTSGGKMTRLDKNLYPEITYENSPVKFEVSECNCACEKKPITERT